MEKQFVPYELAVKLKELGFDEECLGVYGESDNKLYMINYINHPDITRAPLWQQAFDWFREVKRFDLNWKPMSMVGITCYYDIEILHPKYVWDEPPKVTGSTYEQARLACLEKLISLRK